MEKVHAFCAAGQFLPGQVFAGTAPAGSEPAADASAEPTPLKIPPGAVVVPGARAVAKGRGRELGISLYTPVIIKYRDEKTDQAVRLEDLLR